jgi:outer membrane receptor protein involved in Fe transport
VTADNLDLEVDSLGQTLFGEISKEAQVVWNKVFAGKTEVSHKALSPLKAMRQKLSGLSFVEPKVAPIADLIESAVSSVPKRGLISGQPLLTIQGLVSVLKDPALLREYHSDGWRNNDKADKKNFSGRWTYSFTDQFQASLNVRAYNGSWEAPGNISHLHRNIKDSVTDGSGQGGAGYRDRYDVRLWANYFINDESQLTFYIYGTSMETSRFEINDDPAAWGRYSGSDDYSRHKSWGTGLTYNYKGQINGHDSTATLGFTYAYEKEDPRILYSYIQGQGRNRGPMNCNRYCEKLSINNPAVLGEVTYQINEYFNYRLGTRYDWVYGKYLSLRPNSKEIRSKTYGFLSPKTGILFTPNDRVKVYANYGRGFSLPDMNTNTSGSGFYQNNGFNLKVRDQYELGARASVTDWLDLELALFKIFTKNDTVYDETENKVVPSGKTERQGVEFGSSLKPSPHFTLNMNYSYTGAKYKSFIDTGNHAIMDGRKMTNVPAHMLNVDLLIHPENYPFGARISFHGEYDRFASNYPRVNNLGNPIANPVRKTPNYEIVDLLFYYNINENYKLLFNVNNLFDKEYWTGLSHNLPNATTGDWVGQHRPPRTFSLTLEMNWDKTD